MRCETSTLGVCSETSTPRVKKILSFLFLILLFVSYSSVFAKCSWDGGDVAGSLRGCAPTGSVTADDYSLA